MIAPRKIVVFLITILMIFSVAGCSGVNSEEDKTSMPPEISLFEYDGNPDIVLSNELTANEAGLVELTEMIYIIVYVPDGAVSLKTYFAEADNIGGARIMLENNYSHPIKNSSDLELSTGNSFRAADYFPDGFIGSIWAVTTDISGAEYKSDVVNVIWE